MKPRHRPSIIRHVLLTLLLSCGFVKAANHIEDTGPNQLDEEAMRENPCVIPVLPCSANKK